ncbi:MAG TPA: hypothetical protein VFA20_34910 [Myxococcaceae bacterium]|nr:hypothetical protein [Myxococcaceae bacterium]
MSFADGFEPAGQGQGPARGGAPNAGVGAPPAPQQPVAPLFDGSPQATAALHPAVRKEAERLASAQGGQGGFQTAKDSIDALGKINHPDATNVLAYVASNPAATAGLGNDQQLRANAIQQLGNRPGALGPTEIRALANTLGNASPMVGGKAQDLLTRVGAGPNQEQRDRVQTELKRVADQGAPTERMQANDPRREITMDGKSAARATDVLARLGPPNGRWGADDYRRMLKGASLQGAGDGKETADVVKRGLNSRDGAEREMANRAMRAAIDNGMVPFQDRDKAAWLMHDAGRFTPDDIPRLEKLGPASNGAQAALNQMAKDGVDQLHQAGKGGNKDAQQALIALGSGSDDAARKLAATGVRLPVRHAQEPAQKASEALFNAGAGDEATQRDLARVVLGSKQPEPASVTRAAGAVQGDANKGDAKTLQALDTAQQNSTLTQDARAAAVRTLGKAAASGQEGARPAVQILGGIGQEKFTERNDARYQAAVNGLKDAGMAGTPGAWDALRDTGLNAKDRWDPRAGMVNKALVDGALDGSRHTATDAIKALDSVYRGTSDPRAKSDALAALGRAGYGLTEKKGADGKPALSADDSRVTAVRDALRGALVTNGSAEQAAREMRKIAPFLDKNDAQLLADRMDPSQGKAAMQSMFTLSQAMPNLSKEDKAKIFGQLRDGDAIAKLAPKMEEGDVAALKMLAASDDPRHIAGYMDAVLQHGSDSPANRAKVAAAMGLVEPRRFDGLSPEQRSRVVDAIKKNGMDYEVGALRKTLGWSPVEHQEVVQAAKDLRAAGNDGDARRAAIDGNKDRFQKQMDYVGSERFKHRLSLERDAGGRQRLLNYELGKANILDPEKRQDVEAHAKKLFGKEGLDALAKGDLAVDEPKRDAKADARDPILDGLYGLATEGVVWLKDSAAAKHLMEIGVVANNLIDDLDQSTGLKALPPGWNNKAASALDAGLAFNGTGVPARPLKANEVAELKKIFGNSLDYTKIDLAIGTNNMMTKDDRPVAVPMSNGRTTINYPRGGRFADPPPTWSLVHESLHAWQRQHGAARYAPDSVHDQLSKGTHEAYNWQRATGKPWEKWGPEQQAQFIEEAYQAGAFNTPDLKFVHEGTDYTRLLNEVVREIRAGRGAP